MDHPIVFGDKFADFSFGFRFPYRFGLMCRMTFVTRTRVTATEHFVSVRLDQFLQFWWDKTRFRTALQMPLANVARSITRISHTIG